MECFAWKTDGGKYEDQNSNENWVKFIWKFDITLNLVSFIFYILLNFFYFYLIIIFMHAYKINT